MQVPHNLPAAQNPAVYIFVSITLFFFLYVVSAPYSRLFSSRRSPRRCICRKRRPLQIPGLGYQICCNPLPLPGAGLFPLLFLFMPFFPVSSSLIAVYGIPDFFDSLYPVISDFLTLAISFSFIVSTSLRNRNVITLQF